MSLRDGDWDELMYSIYEQSCTPFIGAGACAPWLPVSKQIANKMAREYRYPLDDSDDLEKVSQCCDRPRRYVS